MRLCACLVLLGMMATPSKLLAQEEPPSVASTKALSPEDERKAFILPDGFEVQLVASEPDIGKPIQMAFDGKGRLWVTTSQHYPIAAPTGKATDKLFVLSNFDASGKAKKVEVFADDLNIPMGILPMPDCKSCIVSSAGEIRRYTATKGTGKADKMEVLYTGFGFSDTHGLCNSFTLMPDGWVYACQGGSNESKVKGKDGNEVELKSGCTFRFRPDGSRIEIYTRGHLNPFGIAIDPSFNLYTADSFSKPITQLIPGATYESSGKPHDGLGYAPRATQRTYDRKAFCGLAWYDGIQFPREYAGTMLLGDPVANRIHRDRIEWKGATPVAVEQPDFLASKDPLFSPVDIKLGPEGAIYVADFYSKFAGMNEAELKQERDNGRGRIWRILWKGNGNVRPVQPPVLKYDFPAALPDRLSMGFGTANTTTKLLILNELMMRFQALKLPEERVLYSQLTQRAKINDPSLFPVHVWGYYWSKSTLEGFTTPEWKSARDSNRKVVLDALAESLIHLLRVAALDHNWDKKNDIPSQFVAELAVQYPRVGFALAEVIASHPSSDSVKPLIVQIKSSPTEDTHLNYAAKLALRNCLQQSEKSWQPFIKAKEQNDAYDSFYTEIALAVTNKAAARYLLSQLSSKQLPQDAIAAVAEHIPRYGEKDELTEGLLWLTSLKHTPAIGDGLLKYLRVLKARGKRVEEGHRKWVLDAVEVEFAENFKEKVLYGPEEAARLISVAHVLAALPELLDSRDEQIIAQQTVDHLGNLLQSSTTPLDLRVAAADALSQAAPKTGFTVLRQLFPDQKTPQALRDRVLIAMAVSEDRNQRLDARDALKDAPYSLAVTIITRLLDTPGGAVDLLDAVKYGKFPARLLQEKVILERLRAANIPDLEKQIDNLTKGLKPLDRKISELIGQRGSKFAAAKIDKELGAKVFAKHCMACHSIGGKGGKAAPELDSIGNRGLERLLEDTLDPNRNVNQAYRTRIIKTKDDRTITGLMLRVEKEMLIVADNEGKELRIPLKEIDKNQATMLSLMPTNYGELIPETDFYHLMAYLLDQKAKEPSNR